MGLFLKGRLITMVHVVLAFIVSSLVAAYYIVMFARKFKDPDGVTKAVKAIGMVLELFFCIAALAAIHALHLKTAKTGFGLFSLFGVTSVGVNMIYFGLLVSHRGFEGSCEAASYPCTRSRLLIAFSMALFISSLVNLFVLMVLWHYEIKNSTTAPKPAAPGATTTVPAPAPVAAPAAPVPATTARSLPKATSSRAPVLPAFSFAPDRDQPQKRVQWLAVVIQQP
ncbi:hypothetical protein MNV49_000204 [Pseudohyphozyma bogoriensis]|nr:hypothetical protein MNV49_000204 [Pseudohyphozyma bogoriensis]